MNMLPLGYIYTWNIFNVVSSLYLGLKIVLQKDIGRLDIAMDNLRMT